MSKRRGSKKRRKGKKRKRKYPKTRLISKVPNNLETKFLSSILSSISLIFIRTEEGRSKGKSVSIRWYIYTFDLPPLLTLFSAVMHVFPAIPESRPRGISVDLAPSHAGRPQSNSQPEKQRCSSTVAALCLNSLLPLTKASPARVSGDS